MKNRSKNQSVFCDIDDCPSSSSDGGDNFWLTLKKSPGLAEEFISISLVKKQNSLTYSVRSYSWLNQVNFLDLLLV